jgi:hypothetical protein
VSRYLKLIETRNASASETVRAPEVTKSTPTMVEATFRPTVELGEPQQGPKVIRLNPQFPPCPKCGAVRYWISRGNVMCGSRTCYSAVRFILTSIEFYPVH